MMLYDNAERSSFQGNRPRAEDFQLFCGAVYDG